MATGARIALSAIAQSDQNALKGLSSAPEPSTGSAEVPIRPLFPSDVTLIRLTNQELLMLRGLVTYGSQKELAEATFLSLSTVKTHLRGAYKKLGSSGRSAALTRAGLAGLL